MRVSVHRSAVAAACTRVESPGAPSTFADLETPSGRPFIGAPADCNSGLEGTMSNFAEPSAAAVPEMVMCFVGARDGGATVTITVVAEAAWLRQERPVKEFQLILEAAYPQVPRLWLQQAAEAIKGGDRDGAPRIRCVSHQCIPPMCCAGLQRAWVCGVKPLDRLRRRVQRF